MHWKTSKFESNIIIDSVFQWPSSDSRSKQKPNLDPQNF